MIEPDSRPAVVGQVEPSVRQHTPGPWQFELAPNGGFDIEKDPNDLGRYMVIATRNSHPERAAEMHANARLMATAPELLAELERILPGADAMGWDTTKAKAAIAKALGLAA